MSGQQDGSTSIDSMQDAHDFYNHIPPTDTFAAYDMDSSPIDVPSSIPDFKLAAPASATALLPLPRSSSRSPTRPAGRSVSSPLLDSPVASSTSSRNGSIPSTRSQQRSIKDLVNRLNQTSAAAAATDLPVPVPNTTRRSSESRAKLHKQPRSPTTPKSRSPAEQHGRFHSGGRDIASSMAAVMAPHMAISGLSAAQPASKSSGRRKLQKPLFGEIAYNPRPSLQPGHGISDPRPRRRSESALNQAYIAGEHGASPSQTHLEPAQKGNLVVNGAGLTHKRSRSDITHDAHQSSRYYHTLPRLNTATFSRSGSTEPPISRISQPASVDRPSRIPISSHRHTPGSNPTSPNHRRVGSHNHFPAPTPPAKKKSAASPTPSSLQSLTTRRYDPFASHHASTGQSLPAFIKADPIQKSPPLRSSRPRQHVSTAAAPPTTTTAASRAKARQRYESAISNKDRSSPDHNARRPKKTIPELGRVDFAQRRAKIQRAIIANLPEDAKSDQGSPSTNSSVGGSRQSSLGRVVVTAPQSPADDLTTKERQDNRNDDGEAEETEEEEDEDTGKEKETLETEDEREGEDRDEDAALAPSGLGLTLETNGQTANTFLKEPDSAITSFDMSPTVSSDSEISQSHENNDQPTEQPADAHDTLLSQVMRMRERSLSSTSRTDIESSPEYSRDPSPNPFDLDDRESIQIMLDGPEPTRRGNWLEDPSTARQEHFPPEVHTSEHHNSSPVDDSLVESEDESFQSDRVEVGSSPWMEADSPHIPVTPQKEHHLGHEDRHVEDDDVTPRQAVRVNRSSLMTISSSDWNPNSDAYLAMSRILDEYRISGHMTPEMFEEFERHISILPPDLSVLSRMDGSDAGTIKTLLDSLLAKKYASSKQQQQLPSGSPYSSIIGYSPTDMTTDDSPEDEFRPGTAIIFTPPRKQSFDTQDKRDTHFENQRSNYSLSSSLAVNPSPDSMAGAEEEDSPPTPPPKDDGYSPRSSFGHSNNPSPDKSFPSSARHSRSSMVVPHARNRSAEPPLRLPQIPISQGLGLAISIEPPSTTSTVPPPIPMYIPPPPPPSAKPESAIVDNALSRSTDSLPNVSTTARPATTEDRFRNFAAPPRPSADSRHKPGPITVPPIPSANAFQSSGRATPGEEPLTSATQPPTPNPELKRLLKRKNIIKELVDTEYSYHQDMKIIEDIYKGTVGDLITADDKKVLFGNSDQIESFSLEFYDSLRRAVTGLYVPPKSSRWQNKRGSFSTSNSGERESTSDILDVERDHTTRVGEVFAHFLTHMERIYGAYLRNHDAANQRLAKLQGDATVKCWLAECHNNASDITSAWDLDSLLVKPVQRILKYPLLLQQLVEVTPAPHPDHKALEYAVKEIMNVTHRINEAKKRADLVEQMVTRKGKDSDVRSGLAKAFGRRTEKLKERVGIAEAYQDHVFDELAHKFGGHFIRLQVCMRDVQGSIAEVDKAVHHFLEFANALETFIEVSPSTSPEIESKWRKFILAIRELATVAMPDHKAKIHNHVIKPMLTAIELHKGPQNAIQRRKKRILDYAKCKAIEKSGQKPDKKTLEASEMYEALNEQLKLDLPRLYSLTAELIKACLDCNVVLQTQWMWLWKEKLAPVIDYTPRPDGDETRETIFPENILPSFVADYDIVHSHVLGLAVCNGSLLADAANFLSPQTTLIADETTMPVRSTSRARRPSNISGKSGTRKISIGSEHSPYLISPEVDKSFNAPLSPNIASFPNGQPGFYGRMRSNSSLSTGRGRTSTVAPGGNASNSRMPSLASKSSFTASRPSTASNRPPDLQPSGLRSSNDHDLRPNSGASYFTSASDRFSGMFSSAMPMSDSPTNGTNPSSPKYAPNDTPVMFVAASLFEFNIDRARREAGYPYLTYIEGEVFDVIAQKGELWLAKNQDDQTNSLGWIWEQHFVILSQDA